MRRYISTEQDYTIEAGEILRSAQDDRGAQDNRGDALDPKGQESDSQEAWRSGAGKRSGGRAEYGKKGVLLERTKTTRAGDFLECEIFPVVQMDSFNRQQRRQKSPEAIQKANRERARRQLERLLNANFGPGDLLLHLTMGKPCDLKTMQRLVRNYIQRLKYRARKRGAACKYVYVIETTGEGNRERHHVHMVMSAHPAHKGPSAPLKQNTGVRLSCVCGPGAEQLISRDEAENLWKHGLARADRAQKQEKGLCGFARYITQRKETQRRLMKRSWGASKGLKQPTVTVADKKFSRGAAEKIVRDLAGDARRILEGKYPGFRLIEQPRIRWSDFLPGCYIYAMLEATHVHA